MDSPALNFKSEHYPERYNGRVPKKVKMLKTVTPDFPFFCDKDSFLTGIKEQVFECWVNSHGAVAIVQNGKKLGVRPSEFEVVEWW